MLRGREPKSYYLPTDSNSSTISFSGAGVRRLTTTMTIAADSGTMVKAVTATPVGQDDVSIRFKIENSAGKIVGENQRTESVIK